MKLSRSSRDIKEETQGSNKNKDGRFLIMTYQRLFSPEDQDLFAELSGDYNPIHVDPVAARRLMFGQPVVHGIHCLLWALELFSQNLKTLFQIKDLKSTFLKPVFLNQPIDCYFNKNEDRKAAIELMNKAHQVCRIELTWEPFSGKPVVQEEENAKTKTSPRCLEDQDFAKAHGKFQLQFHKKRFSKFFPGLSAYMNLDQAVSLMATSRLVGMECPGEHSLYSQLIVTSGKTCKESFLDYSVQSFDERFRLVTIQFQGPALNGQILSFVRPQKKNQPGYSIIKNKIPKDAFKGQQALIIGGSRGLGEVTAKLLAAGDADVKITYCNGKNETQKIVDEVVQSGKKASAMKLDVLRLHEDQLDPVKKWQPTHVYYFATPFIFSGEKDSFSPSLYKRFCDYYVNGFMNIIDSLSQTGPIDIFYPSTVAIDEMVPDMREYTAAKAAGEVLCKSINQFNPNASVYMPRLPRLDTDQTTSLLGVENKDPVEWLTKELTAFLKLESL